MQPWAFKQHIVTTFPSWNIKNRKSQSTSCSNDWHHIQSLVHSMCWRQRQWRENKVMNGNSKYFYCLLLWTNSVTLFSGVGYISSKFFLYSFFFYLQDQNCEMEAASVLTLCRLTVYDAGSQATRVTFLYSELLLNWWFGFARIYTAKGRNTVYM